MRYLFLVLLNVPIIIAAIINITTKYKLLRTSKRRFSLQLAIWITALVLVIGALPIYNHLAGRELFEAGDLSLLDILQTTAIVVLFYLFNIQRQRIKTTEKRLRDLHQELSIRVSDDN